MTFDWKKWATNKYLIASLAFIALLLFSDKNNVLDQYKLHVQYNKVKAEHAYYHHQIEEARRHYNELFSNQQNLEKFAREKYLMKRDDEDVFVIVEPAGKTNSDVGEEPAN
ncbi:MAG: septum formation initiator family protein [Bacteroidia bacterium]|jgi:cell division protein FtsB